MLKVKRKGKEKGVKSFSYKHSFIKTEVVKEKLCKLIENTFR